MGKLFDEIDDRNAEFIRRQRMFFVATAPTSLDGLVNLSPKGLDTFAILGPRTVAYLDLTGSGVETIAHLRDNGRICVMFCAFEGPPRILRLHGHGTVIESDDPAFNEIAKRFPDHPGARAVIRVELERIADSCGYAVPLYEYQGERTQLDAWTERKGTDGLVAYREEHNRVSIDGLPGLTKVESLRVESRNDG